MRLVRLINMKEHDTKDISSQSVSEPDVVYARQSSEHRTTLSLQTEPSRNGRMTVDEFCNMLHQYVDEYYDSVQG